MHFFSKLSLVPKQNVLWTEAPVVIFLCTCVTQTLSSVTRESNDVFSPVDSAVFVSVLSLRCKVGQACEEVLRVPLINMAWERALALWGQNSMSTDEHRRRMLTHTLHSSTVRATAAAHKLLKHQVHTDEQRAHLYRFTHRLTALPLLTSC